MSDLGEVIRAPFQRCLKFLQATERALVLSREGIRYLAKHDFEGQPLSHELYPFTHSLDVGLVRDRQQHANYTQEGLRAEIEAEIREGFPIQNGQSTILLWTALETLVPDFATLWIERYPDKVTATVHQRKPRASIGDLLNARDVARTICSRIMEDQPGSAIDRFEYLQNNIGLGDPPIDAGLKRRLAELEALRHVIVHNASIVDKPFLQRCGWTRYHLGNRIDVTYDDFQNYRNALSKYIDLIISRITAPIQPEIIAWWRDG